MRLRDGHDDSKCGPSVGRANRKTFHNCFHYYVSCSVIGGPWGAELQNLRAHHGHMGCPSLGPSWAHGGPKLGPIFVTVSLSLKPLVKYNCAHVWFSACLVTFHVGLGGEDGDVNENENPHLERCLHANKHKQYYQHFQIPNKIISIF